MAEGGIAVGPGVATVSSQSDLRRSLPTRIAQPLTFNFDTSSFFGPEMPFGFLDCLGRAGA